MHASSVNNLAALRLGYILSTRFHLELGGFTATKPLALLKPFVYELNACLHLHFSVATIEYSSSPLYGERRL